MELMGDPQELWEGLPLMLLLLLQQEALWLLGIALQPASGPLLQVMLVHKGVLAGGIAYVS